MSPTMTKQIEEMSEKNSVDECGYSVDGLISIRHKKGLTNAVRPDITEGESGAGDEIRTHDIDLGKVALYH